MTRLVHTEKGFSVVELMVVVAIVGILAVMAVPLYISAQAKSAQATCFSNQRHIEGAVGVWVAADDDRSLADLAGVVNAAHPLTSEQMIRRAPRCPDGGEVANLNNPTAAEGAYTLGDNGIVTACPKGQLTAHGHY